MLRDDPSEDPEGVELARELVTTHGKRCLVWRIMPVPAPFPSQFDVNPNLWVYWVVLRCQLEAEYLHRLRSLISADRSLAVELATRLLDEIEEDYLGSVTGIALGGMTPEPTRIEEGPVRITALAPHELGWLATDLFVAAQERPPDVRALPKGFPFAPTERSLVEISSRHPRRVQPQYENLLHRLILAFELLGYPLHGTGHFIRYTWPSHGRFGGRVVIPDFGDQRVITPDGLRAAMDLAGRMPDDAWGPKRDRRGVAMQRFGVGFAERDPADAVIDFAIGLEAILLPEKFEGELTFRLRLGGALYSTEDPVRRRDIFAQLGKVYSVRSRVVHGLQPPDPDESREASQLAREILRGLLVICLQRGWPTQEQLTQLALASSDPTKAPQS